MAPSVNRIALVTGANKGMVGLARLGRRSQPGFG